MKLLALVVSEAAAMILSRQATTPVGFVSYCVAVIAVMGLTQSIILESTRRI